MKDNNITPLSSGEKEEFCSGTFYCSLDATYNSDGTCAECGKKKRSVDTNIEEKPDVIKFWWRNALRKLYENPTRPVQEKPDKQPIHPVKSLQEIKSLCNCKDEIAKKYGFEDWHALFDNFSCPMVQLQEAAELYASQFKTPPVQEDQDELWRDVLRGTKKGSMEDIIENWKSKYTIVPK